MSLLDDLIKNKKSIEQQSQQVRKEMNDIVARIRNGERITDDPLKDFCITTHGMGFEEAYKKADAVAKQLEKAKGGPALIANDINGRVTVAYRDPGPNEMAPASVVLYRAAFVRDVERTSKGIAIPGQYAYQIKPHGQRGTFGFEQKEYLQAYGLYGTWNPANGPLVVGASEIFEIPNEFYLADVDEHIRPDLDPRLRKDLSHATLRMSIGNTMGLSILVKKDLEKVIIADPQSTTSWDDALCVIEHGTGRKEYDASIAKERRDEQESVFSEILHVTLLGEERENLTALLRRARRLGVHETDIVNEPRPGVRVSAKDYLPTLYGKS